MLTALFIFGSELIRGLSFAILTGIIVGTFLSIFMAAPTVYDLGSGNKRGKTKIAHTLV